MERYSPFAFRLWCGAEWKSRLSRTPRTAPPCRKPGWPMASLSAGAGAPCAPSPVPATGRRPASRASVWPRLGAPKAGRPCRGGHRHDFRDRPGSRLRPLLSYPVIFSIGNVIEFLRRNRRNRASELCATSKRKGVNLNGTRHLTCEWLLAYTVCGSFEIVSLAMKLRSLSKRQSTNVEQDCAKDAMDF